MNEPEAIRSKSDPCAHLRPRLILTGLGDNEKANLTRQASLSRQVGHAGTGLGWPRLVDRSVGTSVKDDSGCIAIRDNRKDETHEDRLRTKIQSSEATAERRGFTAMMMVVGGDPFRRILLAGRGHVRASQHRLVSASMLRVAAKGTTAQWRLVGDG
jgi:hypothetical protein